jgi:hypothetical protein
LLHFVRKFAPSSLCVPKFLSCLHARHGRGLLREGTLYVV